MTRAPLSGTPLDIALPGEIALDWDDVVRCYDYARCRFPSRLPEGYEGLTFTLIAGGHAHNPGLVPMVLVSGTAPRFVTSDDCTTLRSLWDAWAARVDWRAAIETMRPTTPTWGRLQELGAHP